MNVVDMFIALDTLQLFGDGSGHGELVRGGVAAGHPVEQLPLDVQEETCIEVSTKSRKICHNIWGSPYNGLSIV